MSPQMQQTLKICMIKAWQLLQPKLKDILKQIR